MAGIENEDDVVQQFALGEPLAVGLALDQPREHVAARITRMRTPVGDESAQIGDELPDRPLPTLALLFADHRLERAQDRQGPVAQRSALVTGDGQQVADNLHRHGGRKVGDQVGAAFGGHGVEQAVDQSHHGRLHVGDGARRKRPGDDPAHARVQRRIIEDEARRVVLVKQAGAVLGPVLALLVGGIGGRILVDGDAIGIAGEKIAAIGHSVHRRVLAQRVVGGVGIGVVVGRQPPQIEGQRQLPGSGSIGNAGRRPNHCRVCCGG